MNQFELEKGEFKTVSDEILLDNENHRPKAFYEDPSLQVIVAAVLAIGLGVSIQFSTESVPSIATILVAVPGKLWLNALKALVVPLIFVSMVQAIQSMRSLNKSGAVKMVKATIVYYISTTVFAILEGIILVCIFPKPGVASADDLGKLGNAKDNLQSRSVEEQIEGLFLSFIPSNLVAAFLETELLAIIVVAITMGCLITAPSKSVLMKAIVELEVMIVKIIDFVIRLTPIGVFSLVLANLLTTDLFKLGGYFVYLISTTMIGLCFHFLFVYPSIYAVIVRKNPFQFIKGCLPAHLTGFGTASSAATMPVTLSCLKNMGIPQSVSQFTIPLGTTINMDGTALYFPVAVSFLAATQGIPLQMVHYIMIALLATLSSVGATPIPSSGLVLIIMIAEQVGVPVNNMFSVIVSLDWLLDRFRTVVNVTGDMVGSAIVAKVTGITDESVEKAPSYDEMRQAKE